jgi:hypothetical protein
MPRVQSSLLILMLALVGCAADSDEPESGQPAPAARVPVPLTANEISSYQADLASVFAAKANPTTQRSRTSGGVVADAEGHANVALIKVDASGGLSAACIDNEQDAVRFLTTADGLEVK